jgi:hypothetical protein
MLIFEQDTSEAIMESAEMKARTQGEITEPRPWHKPLLQHLVVSMDTGEPEKLGSAEDGAVFNRVVGVPID